MAGINDRMIKAALSIIPKSLIDKVPELIVTAINKKLQSVDHNEGDSVAVLITESVNPIIGASADCDIKIITVAMDGDVQIRERYSGREFINNLIKETTNGSE